MTCMGELPYGLPQNEKSTSDEVLFSVAMRTFALWAKTSISSRLRDGNELGDFAKQMPTLSARQAQTVRFAHRGEHHARTVSACMGELPYGPPQNEKSTSNEVLFSVVTRTGIEPMPSP